MSNESINLFNNIKQNKGRIKKILKILSNKGKGGSNNYFYFPFNQINSKTQVNFIKKEPILFNHQNQNFFSMQSLNNSSSGKDIKRNKILNNFKSNSSSRSKIFQQNIDDNINDLNIKNEKNKKISNDIKDDLYNKTINKQICFVRKNDYDYKMNYIDKNLKIIYDNIIKIQNFFENNFNENNQLFITQKEYKKEMKYFLDKIIQLEIRINEKKQYEEQNNNILKRNLNSLNLINEKNESQNIDSNINIIQLLNIDNKINQIKEELKNKQDEINNLHNYLKSEFNKMIDQIDKNNIKSNNDLNIFSENQIKQITNENQLIDLFNKFDENNNNNIKKNEYNDMTNKYDLILKKFENINPDLYIFLSNQINNNEDNENKKNNNFEKNINELETKINEQINKNNSVSSKNLIPLPFHKTNKKKYKSYSIDKENKKKFEFENKLINIREVRTPSISPTTTITTESRLHDNSNLEFQKNIYFFEEKINSLIKDNKKVINEINIKLNNNDIINRKEIIEISNKQNIKILEIENKILENNKILDDVYNKININEKNIQQLFEIEKIQNISIKNLSTNQSLNFKELVNEKLEEQKDNNEEIILKNIKKPLKNILQSPNLILQNEKIIYEENEKKEIWIYKRPIIQNPILLYNNIDDYNYQIELEEQEMLYFENTNNNSTITSLKNSETNSMIISNNNSINISNNESNKKNENSSSSIKIKFLFSNNNYYINSNEKEKCEEDEKRIVYEEESEKEDNKEFSISNNSIKIKNIKKKRKNNSKYENENYFSIDKEIVYNKNKNFKDIEENQIKSKSNNFNKNKDNFFGKNYFMLKIFDNLAKENKKTEKEKSIRKYKHNEKNCQIKKENKKIENIKVQEHKKKNNKKSEEKNYNILMGKIIEDIKKKK